jgi:16S rRNA G1207 methylase RsmC
MDDKNQHYSTQFPDVRVKIYSVPESLHHHLYLFKTVTGVFSFKKLDLGTKVFIEHMKIPEESKVILDMGCGYGAIGIVIAYLSPNSTVYFTDVNKRAIWCTKENIKYNLTDRPGKAIVLEGSYFEPFESKRIRFDRIYINPPIRNGRREFLELCGNVSGFLNPKGLFQFVIKKKMGAEYIHNYLNKHFSELFEKIEVTFKRSGYWIFCLTSL